mmetsp:Transcript_23780/g.60654  ORF Transcript_23780/g.60654 Transcript_23780/m.60654 type:complete len:566 (+) Transcript_23780:896-2593(+)
MATPAPWPSTASLSCFCMAPGHCSPRRQAAPLHHLSTRCPSWDDGSWAPGRVQLHPPSSSYTRPLFHAPMPAQRQRTCLYSCSLAQQLGSCAASSTLPVTTRPSLPLLMQPAGASAGGGDRGEQCAGWAQLVRAVVQVLQAVGQLRHLGPLVRVARHAAAHEQRERAHLGDVVRQLGQQLRVAHARKLRLAEARVLQRVRDVLGRGVVHLHAREQQRQAPRVARVQVHELALLGRPVPRQLAVPDGRRGLAAGRHELHRPKVGEVRAHDLAVVVQHDQDVGRLDVRVHHACQAQVLQRQHHVQHDGDGLTLRQRPPAQQLVDVHVAARPQRVQVVLRALRFVVLQPQERVQRHLDERRPPVAQERGADVAEVVGARGVDVVQRHHLDRQLLPVQHDGVHRRAASVSQQLRAVVHLVKHLLLHVGGQARQVHVELALRAQHQLVRAQVAQRPVQPVVQVLQLRLQVLHLPIKVLAGSGVGRALLGVAAPVRLQLGHQLRVLRVQLLRHRLRVCQRVLRLHCAQLRHVGALLRGGAPRGGGLQRRAQLLHLLHQFCLLPLRPDWCRR